MSQGELRLEPRKREKVEAHPLPDVAIKALDAAFATFAIGAVLNAEMVCDLVSFEVRTIIRHKLYKNALGGYFRGKRTAGLLERAGYDAAQRDSARGRPIVRWRKVA